MQNWILTPAVKLPIQKTKDGWGSRPYLALGQVVRSVARLDEFPLLP